MRANGGRGHIGFTLLELVITITLFSFILLSAGALLSGSVQLFDYADRQVDVRLRAEWTFNYIAESLKKTSLIAVPNAQGTTPNLLVFARGVNQDNDLYAADPLFPRVDEDSSADYANDGGSGTGGGLLTNLLGGLLGGGGGTTGDDDSDGNENEDPIDGTDNDGDGNIDEDPPANMNNDGAPGHFRVNDDGDGSVDEGDAADDDEDGSTNEDPIDLTAIEYDVNARRLSERNLPDTASTLLLQDVTAFSVTYQAPDSTRGPRYVVSLQVNDGRGSISMSEYVYPRNITGGTGRRVR